MMSSITSKKTLLITRSWSPNSIESIKSHIPINSNMSPMFWTLIAGLNSLTNLMISKSSSLPKKIKSSSTKNSSLPQFDTWSSAKSSKTKSWWSLLNILWSRLLNYLSKSSHHFKSFSKWSQFLLSHLIIKSNSIKLTTLLKLFKELLLTKALPKLISMTPMIKKMILKWRKDFYSEETSAHHNFF